MASCYIVLLSGSGEYVCSFGTVDIDRGEIYNDMYHPSALDIWGRDDKRICVDEFTSDLEMHAHEQVATAYAFA